MAASSKKAEKEIGKNLMENSLVSGIEGRLAAVLNIVTNPYKMLSFWVLNKDAFQGRSEIVQEINKWVEKGTHLPQVGSGPMSYCRNLVAHTPWVISNPPCSEKDARNVSFMKTPDGAFFGDPAVAYSLFFELEHKLSLAPLFGSPGPAAYNIENGIFGGPLRKARILEILSRGPIGIDDLCEQIEARPRGVQKYVSVLIDQGYATRTRERYKKIVLGDFASNVVAKTFLVRMRDLLQVGSSMTDMTDIANQLRANPKQYARLISNSVLKYAEFSRVINRKERVAEDQRIIEYVTAHPGADRETISKAFGVVHMGPRLRRLFKFGKLGRKNIYRNHFAYFPPESK